MRIPFLTRRPRAADAVRPEAKSSATGPLIAFQSHGRPVWTPRDYAALAREGYMRNAIVYRAVRMIAEAAASVPWLLYDGAAELDQHPLLALLKRPNRRQAGPDFREALTGYLLVAGNAYVEAVSLDGTVRELHALRPDRMKVVPGPDGWPEAYEYTVGGRTVRFTDPGEGGMSPILHLTQFHPLDDHYGFAPIEAAAVGGRPAQRGGELEQGAARQFGAAIRRAGLPGQGRRQPDDRAVRAAEARTGGGLHRRQARRPAAALGRRARLEIDEPDAEGHGLHGGEERERARDRAGLRRAADAPRHPRRQHLFELPGGQPRLLARHGAAAGRPGGGSALPLARTGVRRKPATCGSTPTRSTRWRATAPRCGRASPMPISSPSTKSAPRWATSRWRAGTTCLLGAKAEADVDDMARTFAERGDLAHLALFLWASGASGLLVWALSELAALQPAVQRLRQRDRAADAFLQRPRLRHPKDPKPCGLYGRSSPRRGASGIAPSFMHSPKVWHA